MQIKVIRPSLLNFFKMESAGGIILMLTAILAIIIANSPWQYAYDFLLDTPVSVQIGELVIAKPLLLWINDGLMAIFFMLIGLELKREVMQGQLSNLSQVGLPAVAALGGMVVPALIFYLMNMNGPAKGEEKGDYLDLSFAKNMPQIGSEVRDETQYIYHDGRLKVFLKFLADNMDLDEAMNILGWLGPQSIRYQHFQIFDCFRPSPLDSWKDLIFLHQ